MKGTTNADTPLMIAASRSISVTVRPGTRVWWNSPLFGHVSGIVLSGPWLGWILIHRHTITERHAWIPLHWIDSAVQRDLPAPDARAPCRARDVQAVEGPTSAEPVQGDLFAHHHDHVETLALTEDDAPCLK
jgi:hypothetical protein